MVAVKIDGREYHVPSRVADLLRRIIEKADRLAEGTKVLKASLRGHDIKLSVEEDI